MDVCAVVGFALTPASRADWQAYLDGSAIPEPPWDQQMTEGSRRSWMSAVETSLGWTPPNTEMTWTNIPMSITLLAQAKQIFLAVRFRLVEFSPTGKENLLAVTVGGDMAMRVHHTCGWKLLVGATLRTNRFSTWAQ